MKIALLMTGLIRDTEELLRRFKILRNDFLGGIDLDVFCVTSDRRGLWKPVGNRVSDMSIMVTNDTFQKVWSAISPTQIKIISFEEEMNKTSFLVERIKATYPLGTQSPIQNVCSKWYFIREGLLMTDFSNYDLLIWCRLDCKFIPKLDKNQLLSEKSFHAQSMIWHAEHAFGRKVIKSSEELRRLTQDFGYCEDIFYGSPDNVLKLSGMLQFIDEIVIPNKMEFHGETIYTKFIKSKFETIDYIRWSSNMLPDDFEQPVSEIIDVGLPYPPVLVTKKIAKVLQ